ncbi:MAG: secondary thiamine-phosphate synthase enzyme YjbQ [Halobacteriaceae archaeon]
MHVEIETTDRVDVVDVTDRVAAAVPDDCAAGTCHVFVRHTTAGLVVQERESRLLADLTDRLADLVPASDGYRHDELDGNADAHLRAALLGPSVTVPVRDGSLALGTWQSLLLVECDGPRTREVAVTVTPAD